MGELTPVKRLLDLDDDALYGICVAVDQLGLAAAYSANGKPTEVSTLLNLSSTCRRLRGVAAPLVFRQPRTLSDCADGFSRLPSIDPWLTYIENSEPFLRYMKRLRIVMFAMTEQDVSRLSNILSQAKALTELIVLTPKTREGSQKNLKKVIRDSSLAELKSLTISAGLEDLIPRLRIHRSLSIRNDERSWVVSTALLESYAVEGHMKTLVSLQLGETTSWSPALFHTLSEHLPVLRSLGEVRGGKPGYSFEALLKQGNLFPQLDHMCISHPNHLGLRFFNPICTSLHGCTPPTWFCEYHTQGALRYAGRVAFSAVPNLQVLRFDDEEYLICTRDGSGGVMDVSIVIGTEIVDTE